MSATNLISSFLLRKKLGKQGLPCDKNLFIHCETFFLQVKKIEELWESA